MTYNQELKAKNTILPNLHIYWLFYLSPLLSFSLQNILYIDGIFRRRGGGRIARYIEGVVGIFPESVASHAAS